MANVRYSRRAFIISVGALIAGLLAFVRFLQPRTRPQRRLLSVAKDQVPGNGALVFRESRVALVHGPTGYYALDLVCTHLGCTVSVTTAELVCPCHGSRFDRQGKVLAGPADRPLKRYRVLDRGDTLEIMA